MTPKQYRIKVLNEIINQLSQYGKEFDSDHYGLPNYGEPMNAMREILSNILHENFIIDKEQSRVAMLENFLSEARCQQELERLEDALANVKGVPALRSLDPIIAAHITKSEIRRQSNERLKD
jgi:hypothetical protein